MRSRASASPTWTCRYAPKSCGWSCARTRRRLSASEARVAAPSGSADPEGPLGRALAGPDTVGDPHAPVGAAGEVEAGERPDETLDRVHARQVAHVVLRHRLRPPEDAREDRPWTVSPRLAQVVAHPHYARGVVVPVP